NARRIAPMTNLAKRRPRPSTECCNHTGSGENGGMPAVKNVQIDLIKLADGARLLRFTDRISGLSVERKLDAACSVNKQKKQLGEVFEAAVARAQLAFS